jgi:hypothetical protein
MNLPTLLTQMETAFDTLAAAEFAAIINGHVVRSSGDQTRVLSYTSISEKEEYPRNRFSRIDEYLYALRWAEYSLVLYDGSVIQIEYRDRDNAIHYHRLCYQPCPVDVDLSGEPFESPLDEMVLQSLSSGKPEIMRPFASVRFDYNADVVDELHPASHLTFLSAECRIPLRAPLGLNRFLKFVFGNFYSAQQAKWIEAIKLLHFNLQDCIVEQELYQLHLHWRDRVSEHLS